MRLKINFSAANDELVELINTGFKLISEAEADYSAKKKADTYDDKTDVEKIGKPIQKWGDNVSEKLEEIFPTPLEANLFANPNIPFGAVSGDYNFQSFKSRAYHFVKGLNKIRLNSLPEYTDQLPALETDDVWKRAVIVRALVDDDVLEGHISSFAAIRLLPGDGTHVRGPHRG